MKSTKASMNTKFLLNSILLSMLGTPVLAQEAKTEEGKTLEVIEVTAQRTASLASETPIALTAYKGDDLRESGVNDMNALMRIDPSVNITSAAGAAYVAIRGIASTDTTEVGDPSVPISRDNFFTNRSFLIQSSLYDLSRIEVLKGPQGTLNGRNSTGGLIKIMTQRPTEFNEGFVSATLGNYNARNLEFGLNGNMDDLSIRFSGVSRTHDGYRKLEPIGLEGDDEDMNSFRLQLSYRFSDNLSLWVAHQQDRVDAVGDVFMESTLFGPRPNFGDADLFLSSATTLNKVDANRTQWELNYNGENFGVTYMGGFDSSEWTHSFDSTSPAYYADGGLGYPAIREFQQLEKPDTTNHELRFYSQLDGPLEYQFGVFVFDEENTIDSGLYNVEMAALFAPGGNLEALSQVDKYGIKFDYQLNTKSVGYFGQIGYDLSDEFKISIGARYTTDEKNRTGIATLFLPALASPFAPPIEIVNPGDGLLDDSQWTYHVGLDYTPAKGHLVYAKYDTGYKAGGFNSNGSSASLPYDAENLNAFEVGSKSRFLNNTLELNTAAFVFKYKDYQGSRSSEALGGSAGIFNVGDADIMGFEIQLNTLVGEDGRLDFNTSYLSTEFGDGTIIRAGDGTERDISGNDLPNAPEFSATIGYEQYFEVSGGELKARISAKYSSDFYYSVFNDEDTRSDSYTTADFSLSYLPVDYDIQIQAYVRNITDEVILANAAQNFVAYKNTYQFAPPRTYGVMVTYRF